jgi:serine protease AprX
LDVIVTLSLPASLEQLKALMERVGEFAPTHRFSIIDGFSARLSKAQVEALARLPLVVHVEEDSVVYALNNTAQESFGVTKARADAPGLDGDGDGNPASYSAADLVAAVIDTGIDPNHLDLDGGKVLAFRDYVNGRTTSYDDNGHGTHVAGTIAGTGEARADRLYKGVAPGAALVAVKVLNSSGSGSMSNVTAAIDWVVQNRGVYGIEAINLSLGASGCSNGTDATSAAVNRAADAGIVVGVAAGNSGPGLCTIWSPGAATKAITVGAMADLGVSGFKQAYFSSRGYTADGRIKPDISAPGVTVTSADAGTTNGYVDYSGTSMATPFVVGVSLLMRDANPALTPQQVKDTIMATAVDWGRGGDSKTPGSSGADVDYGAGRLDAYAALQAAGAPLGSPPPVPAHVRYEGTLSGTGAQVDYQLNVTNTQFPIGATLIIPSISGGSASSPDFDLYLYGPSGGQVAAADTARRQDELGYKPTATGTYTLRVKSYSGSGGFFVDVSAGLGADATAPTIGSVSPAEGTSGVPAGTNVSVTFSEPMGKPAAEGAFSLVRSGGSAVTGGFSWSGNTMTFDPATDLQAGAGYTATVTTAATDLAGNALAAGKVWTFTVAAAPPPTTTVSAFPGTTTIESGSLRGGTAARLNADDNSYYEVNSTTSGTSRVSSWYGSFPGVSNGLTSLKITYKGKNSATCTQTVSAWRWTTSSWVQLDSRSVGTGEVAIADLTPSGTLADYVSGTTGDGEVRVRVRCTRSFFSFYASGDLLQIVYQRP